MSRRDARRTGLLLATAALLGAVLPAAAPRPAAAVTRIEGEYQLMMDVRKDQRFFPWDWDSNNNDNWAGAQLRIFSTPRKNTEAFVKFEADWKDPENNTPRPNFQFREAHARYLWERPNHAGVGTYLFFRQDRYWVDNYLIRVVDPGIVKNDRWGPNGSGIRVDTWNWKGFATSWIVSDFADQYNPASGTGTPYTTDDAFIIRLRREQFSRQLRLGFTFNRKLENQPGETQEKATVMGFDTRWQYRGVDYLLEYSFSQSPLNTPAGRATVPYQSALDRALPNNGVLMGEIRALRVGNTRTGYLNVAPTAWYRGPLYDNRLGDANRDETGYNINAWYLLPERAITITGNYKNFQKTAYEKRREQELYGEAYLEFVNGFTGRVFLRSRDISRDFGGRPVLEEHDDLFAEVQVESRLAWLRGQGKLKDMGQPSSKQLFNLDLAINLTDKTKIYSRFSFGNDPSILRKGIFAQLQYRPTGNMEMFLEYGPSWIGDSSPPVDDGDLEGSGDQADLFKFILKGTF